MNLSFSAKHRLAQCKQTGKKMLSNAADKSGLPPGSLVHIGIKHEKESKISVVQYNADQLLEHKVASITDLKQHKNNELITWVNIDGLSNTKIVGDIGQELNIHPLVLEDILSTHQRPKLEEYGNFYLVVKGISVN